MTITFMVVHVSLFMVFIIAFMTMAVFGCLFYFVTLLFFAMAFMTVLSFMIMVVKSATFTKFILYETVGFDQLDRPSICANCFQRLYQKSLQFMTYPKNDIRRFQHLCLGRLEGPVMR